MGKLIEDRLNSAEVVASAVDTHADALQAHFEKQFARWTHRGEHAQVKVMLAILARALRGNATDLKEASDAHDRELADDDAPRAARDELTTALVTELGGLRNAVETTYGAATVKRLGFDGKTPTDPKPAVTLARKVVGTVADPKFAWPKPLRKGLRLDPTEWLADITHHATQLDAAIKTVSRETREAEETAVARANAQEAHDELFGPTATFISALMNLLGEHEIATRVRPSTRRVGVVDPQEPIPAPAVQADKH